MKSILLLLAFLAVGLAGGYVAGTAMAPEETRDEACNTSEDAECEASEPVEATEDELPPAEEDSEFDFVKLNNQFVVPVIRDERVSALVVLSVSLQVTLGNGPVVFQWEPKLRDAFLQEMFDFAYLGGFDGPFTKRENLETLRKALLDIGRSIAGKSVVDVLIVDLVRQEV